jgi:hypothetical protein
LGFRADKHLLEKLTAELMQTRIQIVLDGSVSKLVRAWSWQCML